jgi:hypothetical protein
MTRDEKLSNDRGATFVPKTRDSSGAKRPGLSLGEAPPEPTSDRGSDPYNTSGSFDRKKHWARVGRR